MLQASRHHRSQTLKMTFRDTAFSTLLVSTVAICVSAECTSCLLQVPVLRIQGSIVANPTLFIPGHHHLTSLRSHPVSALFAFCSYPNVWFINTHIMRSYLSVASLPPSLLGFLHTGFHLRPVSTCASLQQCALVLINSVPLPAVSCPAPNWAPECWLCLCSDLHFISSHYDSSQSHNCTSHLFSF